MADDNPPAKQQRQRARIADNTACGNGALSSQLVKSDLKESTRPVGQRRMQRTTVDTWKTAPSLSKVDSCQKSAVSRVFHGLVILSVSSGEAFSIKSVVPAFSGSRWAGCPACGCADMVVIIIRIRLFDREWDARSQSTSPVVSELDVFTHRSAVQASLLAGERSFLVPQETGVGRGSATITQPSLESSSNHVVHRSADIRSLNPTLHPRRPTTPLLTQASRIQGFFFLAVVYS